MGYAIDKIGCPMWKEAKKNWFRILIMVLAVVAFAILTPDAAKEWYQIGTGFSYDKELAIAGLTHQQSKNSATHELRVNKAKKDGIIYSALMVNSTHLPLLCLLLISAAILTTPANQKVNKKVFMLFPFIFIWGAAFSGLAHIMITSSSTNDAFLRGAVIWFGIITLFGAILAFGLFVRSLFLKNRYSAE